MRLIRPLFNCCWIDRPLQYSWLPDVFRVNGSVRLNTLWTPWETHLTCRLKILPQIVGPVLTVTIFATGIATAHHHEYNVTLTNSVTPLLAVVVSTLNH